MIEEVAERDTDALARRLTVSADPVACLLVGYGRLGALRPVVT